MIAEKNIVVRTDDVNLPSFHEFSYKSLQAQKFFAIQYQIDLSVSVLNFIIKRVLVDTAWAFFSGRMAYTCQSLSADINCLP